MAGARAGTEVKRPAWNTSGSLAGWPRAPPGRPAAGGRPPCDSGRGRRPGGQRAVDGGHALRRLAHRHVGELVRHRRIGEAPRQCFMSAGQDVDREMRAVAEHRQVGRAVHQAPQHQRRIQRQRGEGIDGQPHVAAVGGARRDDGHAGRIAAQQVAQRPGARSTLPGGAGGASWHFRTARSVLAGFLMHGRSGGARHGLVARSSSPASAASLHQGSSWADD